MKTKLLILPEHRKYITRNLEISRHEAGDKLEQSLDVFLQFQADHWKVMDEFHLKASGTFSSHNKPTCLSYVVTSSCGLFTPKERG